MRAPHTDLRICQEEIFGPVAAAIPFRDDVHALELANGTRMGWPRVCGRETSNRAHRFVRDLESGAVWVNTYRKIHWAVPFGGVKESGYGRDRAGRACSRTRSSRRRGSRSDER